MRDDLAAQVDAYLYQRSIVLHQDKTLHRALQAYVRSGKALPKNNAELRPVIVASLRKQLPPGQVDEATFNEMVDFYLRLGKTSRGNRWLSPLILLLTLGLLVAVVAAAVRAYLDEGGSESLQDTLDSGRAVATLVATSALYYWASWKLYKFLALIRMTLLLVLIVLLFWLLQSQGWLNLA